MPRTVALPLRVRHTVFTARAIFTATVRPCPCWAGYERCRALPLAHQRLCVLRYHGVPALVLPKIYDNFNSASYVRGSGMGLSISMDAITSDNVREAIETILSDPRCVVGSLMELGQESPLHCALLCLSS